MSKHSLKNWLLGYADIFLPKEKERAYLDLFIKKRIIFNTSTDVHGRLYITVPFGELRHIKRLLADDYSNLETVCKGSVKYLLAYKRRPGLLVGALTAILISTYFSTVVWNIEITGNETISDAHVLELLGQRGLVPGVSRRSLDLDSMTNDIVIRDGSIAWISVNFRGTTAYVELEEYKAPDRAADEPESACNIVASRDGMILSLDVYSGSGEVSQGESVKKGDLLISGIVDTANEGYKLKRADGLAVAEVVDTVRVEIPYKYVCKVSTGRTKVEKNLIFFGKRIQFSKNSGNVYDKCDIIENIKRIEPFDTVRLPVELVETIYNEYSLKELEYTSDQARALAYAGLNEEIARLASTGDITATRITEGDTGSGYVIEATVYHTQNIASVAPISTK